MNPAVLTNYFNERVNTLIAYSEGKVYRKKNSRWFPTPGNMKTNPEHHTGPNRKIYNAISEPKSQTLDPINSEQDGQKFLQQFLWENSVFNDTQKRTVEKLPLRFHNIFARHRPDIGLNNDFKVKLTPENSKPMYTPGSPTPIHYRDEIPEELEKFQDWGKITTIGKITSLRRCSTNKLSYLT